MVAEIVRSQARTSIHNHSTRARSASSDIGTYRSSTSVTRSAQISDQNAPFGFDPNVISWRRSGADTGWPLRFDGRDSERGYRVFPRDRSGRAHRSAVDRTRGTLARGTGRDSGVGSSRSVARRYGKRLYAVAAVPPVVAILTILLAPDPHDHWSEHLWSAYLDAA